MTINMKKLIILNVTTLAVLTGAGIGGYHFYDQSVNYVKTDNAKIDGKQIVITSPTAGKLTNWQGNLGKNFEANSAVGQVLSASSDNSEGTASTDITVPTDVTIVANKAVDNSLIGAGTPLAYGYDFNHLWVTANIDETDINDIETGQEVDIYVDAHKDATLSGKIEEVGLSTSSEFSLLPSNNSNANYTKVTQVVPVKISINDAEGKELLPGMNVSIRVHK